MLNQFSSKIRLIGVATVVMYCFLLSGCAVALIAGGAAGGYLLAQKVDIKKKEQAKKNWFQK